MGSSLFSLNTEPSRVIMPSNIATMSSGCMLPRKLKLLRLPELSGWWTGSPSLTPA